MNQDHKEGPITNGASDISHGRTLNHDVNTGRRHHPGAAGWREAAIAEALRYQESLGGGPINPLLATIRHHRPNSSQAILECKDGGRTFSILRQKVPELRPLLGGEPLRRGDGKGGGFTYHVAWAAFEWEGEHVEIALCPGRMGYDDLIFICDSERAATGVASLLEEALERPEGRCMVFTGGGWEEAPELDAELEGMGWEEIVLPAGTLEEIRASAQRFFRRRDDYRSMGFPWRRGLLLVGPPGTGKTMVCKAIAATEDVPFLYVRDIEGPSEPYSIARIFARARSLAPAILAFEDIDGLVNEANRTVFLNELDGFESNDGLLVVASSNHPERVDEALLKRPSRFDRVFHLALPGEEARKEYCLGLLERAAIRECLCEGESAEEVARSVAAASAGLTPAHLKEAVLSAALSEVHGEGPGASFEEAALAQVGTLLEYLSQAQQPQKMGELEGPHRPFGFNT